MEYDNRVSVPLTAEEQRLLQAGIREWGGPAFCTQELALAMGFDDVDDLLTEGERLRAALATGEPLSPFDWTRVLVATEVVFASDVFGSGWDWRHTVGLTDEETIRLLRQVQRKLIGIARGTIGNGLGTLPQERGRSSES